MFHRLAMRDVLPFSDELLRLMFRRNERLSLLLRGCGCCDILLLSSRENRDDVGAVESVLVEKESPSFWFTTTLSLLLLRLLNSDARLELRDRRGVRFMVAT